MNELSTDTIDKRKGKVKMKVLVTGAAGFIGSHLCERLLEEGNRVIGIDDLSNGKLSNLEAILNNPNFHFMSQDISKPLTFETGLDCVFHLAAKADIVPSIEKPDVYHDVNVTGTLNVLKAATAAKTKRLVYAASSSCYGIPEVYPTHEHVPCDPQYPYALTKYVGEQYVQHWGKVYGLSTISLRLFNVYGPRSRTSGAYGAVFGVFLSQLANSLPLTVVGDGAQSRDFTFVSDVVSAFVAAGRSELRGIFNIGTGKPQAVNRLVELLGAKDVVHLPKRPGEPDVTHAQSVLARMGLNWEPKVTFEQGVGIMKTLIPKYKDAPAWTKESIEKATKTWFDQLGEKK